MPVNDERSLQYVSELAVQGLKPVVAEPGAIPMLVLPPGFNMMSLENTLPSLRRIKQCVSVFDVESFRKYLADLDPGKDARVFASISGSGAMRVEAVLDYHQAASPKHCSHRLLMTFEPSPEWAAWAGASGKPMEQVAFAQFVETNLPDIVAPEGAELLEICKSIEAKKGVQFASAIRLDNGQREFKYVENIEGTAKHGTMAIPEQFILGLRPFVASELYQVAANLRYRIDGGALKIWFELVRPQRVIEATFNDIVKAVGEIVGDRLILGSIG